MPPTITITLAITSILFASWWIYHKNSGIRTIRSRLLLGFVLMALLLAIAISAGSIIVGYYTGQQQAFDRLESVAALKESEISAWTDGLQSELITPLSEEYVLERPRVVLGLAQEHAYYDYYYEATRKHLLRYTEQTPQFHELFLLDLQGRVVLSTDTGREGEDYNGRINIQNSITEPTITLSFADSTAVFATIPIVGIDGQLMGIMAGRAAPELLYEMLRERTGLGTTGKAYLVGTNQTLITGDGVHNPQLAAHSEGIDAAVEHQANGSGVYDDYQDTRVVGIYRWLPELQVALLVEQNLSEAFAPIYTTLIVNLGIALVALILVVTVSSFISNSIANPLVDLAETAAQIASGDLEKTAQVGQKDEIGTLALAFNSMTAQLRDLINNLERQVKERTQTLRHRAVQLETSAQVSREITSILEIDDLLDRVVALIRKAFAYYHVSIFLVDDETGQLILRASSGEKTPLHQSLPLNGHSLNSEAVKNNEAVMINNVLEDGRFLPDDHLPRTRSEMIVPLRVGERIMGTLDAHSAKLNDFTAEDVLVIQSLGDQIAIAIENARLYDQSRELAVLEERQRLARELHDSVTQSLFSLDLHVKAIATNLHRNPESVETQIQTVRQITHDALEEMRTLIHDLRPVAMEKKGLASSLRQHINTLHRASSVELMVEVTGERRLSDRVEKELFRITQEAINNALKHADAQQIVVQLVMNDEQVTLSITDDGCGFDAALPTTNPKKFGLIGLRERAEAIDGQIEITSELGKGTRIKVSVPI